MERPTCKTCPYWILMGKDDDDDEFGECRHTPPDLVQADAWDDYLNCKWPRTYVFNWCGEHPDFPAYIAATRKRQPTADGEPTTLYCQGQYLEDAIALLNSYRVKKGLPILDPDSYAATPGAPEVPICFACGESVKMLGGKLTLTHRRGCRMAREFPHALPSVEHREMT